jgi:hypothetical protein
MELNPRDYLIFFSNRWLAVATYGTGMLFGQAAIPVLGLLSVQEYREYNYWSVDITNNT